MHVHALGEALHSYLGHARSSLWTTSVQAGLPDIGPHIEVMPCRGWVHITIAAPLQDVGWLTTGTSLPAQEATS